MRLNINEELLNERTCVPRFRVRVCVPGLLFHPECGLGEQCFQPARQMATDVIDLLGILTVPSRAVLVRSVFDDLYSTARAGTLQSTFFLCVGVKTNRNITLHDFLSITNLEFWSELELLIFQPISISRVA